MQKKAKFTKKALTGLGNLFHLEEESDAVLMRIEEKLNVGDFDEWIAPRKGKCVTVAISGMRFVLIVDGKKRGGKKSGLFLVLETVTPSRLDSLTRGWAKKGEEGAAAYNRGKPLRSMPFAALEELL